jgi:hypothetical protein
MFYLCLINYAPRHEEVWESGDIIPPFLASVRDGDEWSASRLSRFTPCIHWIQDWASRRSGLDVLENRKFLASDRSRTSIPLSSSP